MKKLLLKSHSSYCNKSGCSINHFLFQYDFDFYIISYPSCLERYGHLNLKESFLKDVCDAENKKLKKVCRIYKGGITENVKMNMNVETLMENKITEICYCYTNCADIDFCMCREYDFIDFVISANQYEENYKKAIQCISTDKVFIKFNMYKEHLLNNLSEIYNANGGSFCYFDNWSSITLSDLLTNKILQNE